MNVKKLLESHKEIDERINLALEELAQLRSLSERVTMRLSFSGGSGTHSDRVGTYAVKIADLEQEIDREVDRLVEVKEYIKTVISSLDSETERSVLWRRYILHETTETIGEKLGYSSRHITRLMKSALLKLEVIYMNTEDIA